MQHCELLAPVWSIGILLATMTSLLMELCYYKFQAPHNSGEARMSSCMNSRRPKEHRISKLNEGRRMSTRIEGGMAEGLYAVMSKATDFR
eukprot:scaffold227175_cov18-Tisochrysis_lutea.AAC.1